jgi:putative DNA primase/helicase
MLERTPLSERCRGRWRDILFRLGAIDAKLLDGKHHPCPWCGGRDRWRFTNHNGAGAFICNQCGAGDGAELVKRSLGLDFKSAALRIEEVLGDARIKTKPERSDGDNRAAMTRLWRSARRIERGDPVDHYLLARLGKRMSGDDWPAALRSIPTAEYWTDGIARRFPALMAKICAPDGAPCQIQRTFLLPEGAKAPVSQPKKLMPGALPKGSAVRLAPVGDDGVLGVGEGLETALSASLIHRVPVWACICAANLADFEPPKAVRRVIVYGDNDLSFTGQEAAYRLAKRLTLKGLGVDVQIPPKVGDWNDALTADWQGEAHAFP